MNGLVDQEQQKSNTCTTSKVFLEIWLQQIRRELYFIIWQMNGLVDQEQQKSDTCTTSKVLLEIWLQQIRRKLYFIIWQMNGLVDQEQQKFDTGVAVTALHLTGDSGRAPKRIVFWTEAVPMVGIHLKLKTLVFCVQLLVFMYAGLDDALLVF
jgi:hypothetical protein